MKTMEQLRAEYRKRDTKLAYQILLSTIEGNMEIRVIDHIFDTHAFHKGDCEKPFAMVRSDFREACRDIEKATHNELLNKYTNTLSKVMNNLGWENKYVIEIIDEMRKELK